MEQLHLVYPLHDIALTVTDGKAGSSISISLSSIIIYDIIYFIVVIGCYLLLLSLGAHAQRGLQYLVCQSVCLSVCLSAMLFWQYAQLKV